jgi:hypothetical protein
MTMDNNAPERFEVLVADDSAVYRKLIEHALPADHRSQTQILLR